MTSQRVDPGFERMVNDLRSRIAKDMGVNISFKEGTKLVRKMLDGFDVNFNISQIPKSKMQEIKMKVKRKRR